MVPELKQDPDLRTLFPQEQLNSCIRSLKNFHWPEGYALLPLTCSIRSMWMQVPGFQRTKKLDHKIQAAIADNLWNAHPQITHQVLPIFLYDSTRGISSLANCLFFLFEKDLENASQIKKITLLEVGEDFKLPAATQSARFQQQIFRLLQYFLGEGDVTPDSFEYVGGKQTYIDRLQKEIPNVLNGYFYPTEELHNPLPKQKSVWSNKKRYAAEVGGSGLATTAAGLIAKFAIGASTGPISAAVTTTLLVSTGICWAYEGVRDTRGRGKIVPAVQQEIDPLLRPDSP